MKIRVAHSPDSDDAFMFYAINQKKIDLKGYEFEDILSDIETLNREALKGTYEVSAIVPGTLTSAFLVLKLFNPNFSYEVVPFDQIIERVKKGEFDAGLR